MRCASGYGARFKFTPFVCIAFRRIANWCKKRGFKFSFAFAKLRAGGVALVAFSAENCASAVAPCMSSALLSLVSAIKWRLNLIVALDPGCLEATTRRGLAKRVTTSGRRRGLAGLRYPAIRRDKPRLYYDRAVPAPR